MLKKNLSKRVTSAVLAIFFLCVSVAPVCSASNPPKKRPKLKGQSSWMNVPPPSKDFSCNLGESSTDDGDEVGNTTGNSSNNDETEGNNFNVNDDYDYDYDWEEEEEEECNETTKNGDEVGNNASTVEEENNNLNENDDHIANAEESGTQNGNTATNNNNQNNPARSQNAAYRDYQESWNEIVFDDNNNE